MPNAQLLVALFFSFCSCMTNQKNDKENNSLLNVIESDSVVISIKTLPLKSVILNLRDQAFNNVELYFVNKSNSTQTICKSIKVVKPKMLTHFAIYMGNPKYPVTFNHAILISKKVDTLYLKTTDSSDIVNDYKNKTNPFLDEFISSISNIKGKTVDLLKAEKIKQIKRINNLQLDTSEKRVLSSYVEQSFYYSVFRILSNNNNNLKEYINSYLIEFEKYLITNSDIITTNSQLFEIHSLISSIVEKSKVVYPLVCNRYEYIYKYPNLIKAKTSQSYLFYQLTHDNLKNDKCWMSAKSEFQKLEFYTANKKRIDSIFKNGSLSNILTLINKFTLINPKNELKTLLQIFEKNNKDFYLVDFWATWCIPCKKESIKLEQLRASLPNNVGILRISLDKQEDKTLWHTEAKNDLNSFFTKLNFEEPICKVLKINEIPRFVLFKRNGELMNDNFLMPSEPNFLKNINELSIK